MHETAARMLALLSLLQARPDWPGPELAQRLGVSDRTIRNDVARLRDLGYPVDAVRGAAGTCSASGLRKRRTSDALSIISPCTTAPSETMPQPGSS